MDNINTQVCIIGAGPGGAVLGLVLARAGIKVILIERSKSPERKFRGEFISPDSVAILKKLKILEQLDEKEYLYNNAMEMYENNKLILKIDFNLNPDTRPIDIPQPVLLNCLIKESLEYSNFIFLSKTTAKKLMIENNKISGVICQSDSGEIVLTAQLVVSAEGRYGKMSALAGLTTHKQAVSRDFVWFNLPRPAHWEAVIKLKLYKNYQLMILPTYPDLLRVGFNIPSGEYGKLVKKDIQELHVLVGLLEPALAEIVKISITHWSQTSLLDIFTMTLPSWCRDGFVVIGDAAHTLTPVLGQGVNHAITDAVVLAEQIIPFMRSQANATEIMPKKILQDFENRRRADVEFVRRFQLQQEKMLQLKGRFSLWLRKIFYLILGKTVLKKILIKKIFYCNKVVI